MPLPRVRVTLLSGFLGAGKTTLLRRLLTSPHGHRIAVIVNEFGELHVDGQLIRSSTDEVIELTNGCVCCSVRGDLAEASRDLFRRRERLILPLEFDHLVIEATGIASPGPILQTFLVDQELAARTELDGVVTLAHAAHIAAQLAEHPEAADQIAAADLVLLNHVDTAGPEVADAAERAIRGVNAHAPLVRSTHADVEIERVLDVGGTNPANWSAPTASGHGASGFQSVALTHAGPVDFHRLKMWLQFVASRRTWKIIRLKGVFHCPERPRAVVAQGIYQWLEFGPSELPRPATSHVVLIGLDLDEAELRRGWANVCGEPAPPGS